MNRIVALKKVLQTRDWTSYNANSHYTPRKVPLLFIPYLETEFSKLPCAG